MKEKIFSIHIEKWRYLGCFLSIETQSEMKINNKKEIKLGRSRKEKDSKEEILRIYE
jgi:hypothetical protein